MVNIALADLTNRQLKLHLIKLLEDQVKTNRRLEQFMSNLSSSVEDMQTAVDTMAVRFASQMGPLTESLAAAQAALADLQVSSDADKAALQAALNEMETAAASINSDVAELNAIGAAPDVPVEPVPVEEMPAPPSESPGSDIGS